MVTRSPEQLDHRYVAGAAPYRQVENAIRARLIEVAAGMSIAAFADAIKLNRETVRRALRGSTIRSELIVRVCARFDVSADWLLFGIGSRHGAGMPQLLELKRPSLDPALTNHDPGTNGAAPPSPPP